MSIRQSQELNTGKPAAKDAGRSRAFRKALLFGAGSIGLYVALYAYSGSILEVTTKGHFYAVLPVAAAFLFSYVHGTFTGNFWTAMGVNASSKVTAKRPTDAARKPARQDRRPRAQAQM